MNKIIAPTTRVLNPRRIHLQRDQEGWTAVYRTHDGLGPSVSGCKTRREAIFHICRAATMRVVQVDGRFERLPSLLHIFALVVASVLFVSGYAVGSSAWALLPAAIFSLVVASESLRWIVLYHSAEEVGS